MWQVVPEAGEGTVSPQTPTILQTASRSLQAPRPDHREGQGVRPCPF